MAVILKATLGLFITPCVTAYLYHKVKGSNITEIPLVPADVTSLLIQKTSITTIRNTDLTYLSKCYWIDLTGNKIEVIESKVFKGLSNLRLLKLPYNMISNISEGTFSNLTKLTSLHLSGNRLTSLYNHMFKDLKRLSSLYLSENHISQYEDHTFQSNKMLQNLHLDYNHLKLFNRNQTSKLTFLHGLCHLRDLHLSHNSFRFIPYETFSDYILLRELWLNNNSLTELHNCTFKHVVSLIHLCLDHNYISHIDAETFKQNIKLRILYLSHNFISNIDKGTFSNLIRLSYLLLSHNNLIALHDYTFSSLEQLRFLSIAYNNISHVDDETFKFNMRLRKIFLKGNNIQTVLWGIWLSFDANVEGLVCPVLSYEVHKIKCTAMGQNTVTVFVNQTGCLGYYCKCPPDPDCNRKCLHNPYKLTENQFGCKECKCFCPRVDCDAACPGTGLGIVGPKDKTGCYSSCVGCRDPKDLIIRTESKKERSQAVNHAPGEDPDIIQIILLAIVALLGTRLMNVCFVSTCIRSKINRNSKRVISADKANENVLDLLVSNLDSDLSWQVRDSWIDPITITQGHFLGHNEAAQYLPVQD